MQHARIIKLLVCLATLTVLSYFISCGGGGGGGGGEDNTPIEQYTLAPDPDLTADADGTIAQESVVIDTSQTEGTAEGTAQVTIEPGTQAYVGDQPAQGKLTTEVAFHDGESEATFPGGSFKNVMLDGRLVDIKSYGMFVIDMEDETGASVTDFSEDMEINIEILETQTTQTAGYSFPFLATAYAVQTTSFQPYTGNLGSLGSFTPGNPFVVPDPSDVPSPTNPGNPNPGGPASYYVPGAGTFMNTLITTPVLTDTRKRKAVMNSTGDDSPRQKAAQQGARLQSQQMMRMLSIDDDLLSDTQRRWQLKMKQHQPNTYLALAITKEYPTEEDIACCESCEGVECDECAFDCDEIANDALSD